MIIRNMTKMLFQLLQPRKYKTNTTYIRPYTCNRFEAVIWCPISKILHAILKHCHLQSNPLQPQVPEDKWFIKSADSVVFLLSYRPIDRTSYVTMLPNMMVLPNLIILPISRRCPTFMGSRFNINLFK